MHSRWQRTRKQRRAAAVAKLVSDARLPPAAPLREAAQRAGSGSRVESLAALATDDFVENARHLLLVTETAGRGAASSFAGAVARLGHATRCFTPRELCDRLGRAHAEGRFAAELRDLDPVPLLAVEPADPGELDASSLELWCRFLRHRLDRGSTVLAGAGVESWRRAALSTAEGDAIDAFLGACEVIDLSQLDRAVFAPTGAEPARDEAAGDAEARALRA
jgi:hypothetical protein